MRRSLLTIAVATALLWIPPPALGASRVLALAGSALSPPALLGDGSVAWVHQAEEGTRVMRATADGVPEQVAALPPSVPVANAATNTFRRHALSGAGAWVAVHQWVKQCWDCKYEGRTLGAADVFAVPVDGGAAPSRLAGCGAGPAQQPCGGPREGCRPFDVVAAGARVAMSRFCDAGARPVILSADGSAPVDLPATERPMAAAGSWLLTRIDERDGYGAKALVLRDLVTGAEVRRFTGPGLEYADVQADGTVAYSAGDALLVAALGAEPVAVPGISGQRVQFAGGRAPPASGLPAAARRGT